MHKFSITIRFLIYTFFAAIIINPLVISAHILTTDEFDLSVSAKIILQSFGASIVFFALICFALFFVAMLLRKKSKETRYWIIMLFAITITAILFYEFQTIFSLLSNDRVMIASISAFSIMVSLASQYTLFVDEQQSVVVWTN